MSAQIDRNFNEFDNAWGMFGFLEFEEDPDVVALLDAASAWLRERGATAWSARWTSR